MNNKNDFVAVFLASITIVIGLVNLVIAAWANIVRASWFHDIGPKNAEILVYYVFTPLKFLQAIMGGKSGATAAIVIAIIVLVKWKDQLLARRLAKTGLGISIFAIVLLFWSFIAFLP